jgi:hypothetical protein
MGKTRAFRRTSLTSFWLAETSMRRAQDLRPC